MKNKYFNILLSLYIFLIPFEEALNLGFGSLLRYVGLGVIFTGLLNIQANMKFKFEHLPLLLWFVLYVISFFWSISYLWWLYYFQIYATQILFILVIIVFNEKNVDLQKVSTSLIISSVLASLILYLPNISAFTEEGRRTIILFNKILDPNILASFLALSAIVLIDLISKDKRKKINYLILFIIISGVLFTGSRGTLISMVMGFLFYFILSNWRSFSKKYLLKYVVMVIVATIILYNILPKSLLDRFAIENLFGLNEIDTNIHSRYTIWSHVPALFIQKPLLGYGGGGFMTALDSVYRQSASHNIYVLQLIELGIVGILLLVVWISILVLKAIKIHSPYVLSLLTTLFSISMFIDSLSFKFFWVFLSIVYIILNKTGDFKV